jgi:hypothetical protein
LDLILPFIPITRLSSEAWQEAYRRDGGI